jgi:hypothetical protein
MRSLIEDEPEGELGIGPNGTSLDLLRAVYRSSSQPLGVRMRAAGLAIRYEHPALIATAVINESSFAELLERRIERHKAISEGKVIEHQPQQSDQGPELKPQMPRVPDRRFRRI